MECRASRDLASDWAVASHSIGYAYYICRRPRIARPSDRTARRLIGEGSPIDETVSSSLIKK